MTETITVHTAREFVGAVPWVQVKDRPVGDTGKAPDPHQYVIREWRRVDTDAFHAFCDLIRSEGYRATYVAPYRPDYVGTEKGQPRPAGTLRFQPVELLASDSWLITCWHPIRVFRGSTLVAEEEPGSSAEARREVTQAWENGSGENAGDLGVLIMHELSLGYAAAHRAIYAWLEDWQLGFYTEDERFDRGDLADLWRSRALLRDWLDPLNKPGLCTDRTKAWLPAKNHDLVVRVDDRVDRALEKLAGLGESLRASFSLLHLQQGEEAKEQTESMQHRVELAAAIFLVPTLIVGFYGANTWVPGQGRHWGFWVMVGILVLVSMVGLGLVIWDRRSRRAVEARQREERDRFRREILGAS